jgi:hypothetical protein
MAGAACHCPLRTSLLARTREPCRGRLVALPQRAPRTTYRRGARSVGRSRSRSHRESRLATCQRRTCREGSAGGSAQVRQSQRPLSGRSRRNTGPAERAEPVAPSTHPHYASQITALLSRVRTGEKVRQVRHSGAGRSLRLRHACRTFLTKVRHRFGYRRGVRPCRAWGGWPPIAASICRRAASSRSLAAACSRHAAPGRGAGASEGHGPEAMNLRSACRTCAIAAGDVELQVHAIASGRGR